LATYQTSLIRSEYWKAEIMYEWSHVYYQEWSHEYYQELKNNDKQRFVFNIDKIGSMNDETFKTWFSYD